MNRGLSGCRWQALLSLILGVVLLAAPARAGWIVTQLTDNSYDDREPQVSGTNVVWEGYDGDEREIFLYNGATAKKLTDNSYADLGPQVSGSTVVWYGYDGNDYEIFMATFVPDPHWEGATGNWNEAAKWDPDGVPNNGGGDTYHAYIDAVTGSAYTVTLSNSVTVDALTINSADATVIHARHTRVARNLSFSTARL